MPGAIPLEVAHLTKQYLLPDGGRVVADSDVSFTVSAGECFGLLGPNGAGKSTAIHCISGFYPATSGTVRLLGHDVHTDPRRARQALGQKWTMPIRDWKAALNRLTIQFDERMPRV